MIAIMITSLVLLVCFGIVIAFLHRVFGVLHFVNKILALAEDQCAAFEDIMSGRSITETEQVHILRMRRCQNGILQHLSIPKLIFSFKPLKQEQWLTEPELKFLVLKDEVFSQIRLVVNMRMAREIDQIRHEVNEAAATYLRRNTPIPPGHEGHFIDATVRMAVEQYAIGIVQDYLPRFYEEMLYKRAEWTKQGWTWKLLDVREYLADDVRCFLTLNRSDQWVETKFFHGSQHSETPLRDSIIAKDKKLKELIAQVLKHHAENLAADFHTESEEEYIYRKIINNEA